MVDNKKIYLILAIILIVAAIYFIPKLSLFTIYGGSRAIVSPYSVSDFGTGRSGAGYDPIEKSTNLGCPNPPSLTWPTGYNCPAGSTAQVTYGADSEFDCDPDSTLCAFIRSYFDLVPSTNSSIENYVLKGDRIISLYYYSSSSGNRYFYGINSAPSCNSNGCSGTEIPNSGGEFLQRDLDLSSYKGSTINTFYFVSYRRNVDSKCHASTPCWGGHTDAVSLNLQVENKCIYSNECVLTGTLETGGSCSRSSTDGLTCKDTLGLSGICSNQACLVTCTENQIVILSGNYKICHNGVLVAASNLVLLTPEEQAAVAAQINALNATIAEKAALIANLSLTINGQVTMINALQLDTAQKAQLIQQLSNNITYQAQLISQMQLTSAQQLATIQALNLNIADQAIMINNLQTNLDNKIYLISQLQVENANQAQLISQMNLSFANQAYIIQQLRGNITDDAQIIQNLHLNIADQATLINSLRLERDQLSELVNELQLSNADTASLLNNLQLTVNDQIAIIANLNRSVQDEQQIVNNLNRTIEEQNQIIADLKNNIVPEQYDIRYYWDNYKVLIIAIAVLVGVAIFFGGRKR